MFLAISFTLALFRHLLCSRPCQEAILPGIVKKVRYSVFGHLLHPSLVPPPALVSALSGGHPAWLSCQKGKRECILAICFILAMLCHLLWFQPCQVAILPGFRVKKAKENLFWPFSHVPPSALVSALSGGHPAWQSCQKGKIESFLAIFSHVPPLALV